MRASHDRCGIALASLALAVALAGCGGGGGGGGGGASTGVDAASGSVASAPANSTGSDAERSETTDSRSKESAVFPQPETASALPEEELPAYAEATFSNDALLITAPQDRSTDVHLDQPIVLAYKEKIVSDAVISVSLYDSSGEVPSSFYMSQSSIVVVPETSLRSDTLHTVRVVTITRIGGTEKTVAQIVFTTRKA